MARSYRLPYNLLSRTFEPLTIRASQAGGYSHAVTFNPIKKRACYDRFFVIRLERRGFSDSTTCSPSLVERNSFVEAWKSNP